MAISRVKTWVAGEVLTAADQNAEFNNILDNALALISPLTGTLNVNLNQLTNVVLERLSADATAATEGRVYFHTGQNCPHFDDSAKIYRVLGLEHSYFKLGAEVWS